MTSKLNTELRKKLVMYYVWSIALALRPKHIKKIGVQLLGELRNVVLDENGEDKMDREVTNELIERIEEKRTHLDNI